MTKLFWHIWFVITIYSVFGKKVYLTLNNIYYTFFLQVRRFSQSCQTKNPLDSLSNLLKRAGSFRNAFTSWQHKPNRNRTHSDNSFIEVDHFNPHVKMEEIGDTNGVQTCSLYAPPQSRKPAVNLDNLCYEAESPDEAALVYAAKAYGFILLARTPDSVTIRLPSGEDLVFEVLDTLAFDYNRKRMSVLVRHPITKEYVLYTKGADYAIMELLGTPYAGMYRGGTFTNVYYMFSVSLSQYWATLSHFI